MADMKEDIHRGYQKSTKDNFN